MDLCAKHSMPPDSRRRQSHLPHLENECIRPIAPPGGGWVSARSAFLYVHGWCGSISAGRKRPNRHRPLSLSARVIGAPRIRRPQTSAHSKHADACDSCVAGSVIWRSRINPSEAETPAINRKYYRPFSRRSLSGAAFRAMTGRTVNPQVPGSSPGRGANHSIAWSTSRV